ncbi:hypothetical protein QJS10_CPB11g00311 [Acorus calamus]|uniref:Uncharacterized protein n=1 Tax=Acorus calamus TaxID=4465 RepID=A0AAV9DQN2_ACOCL|nr:hypothetical protein QJS10_CPB11g00311 [Acorus calamus]
MTRRCSHCSQNGHNSRTCPNRGVKLFGVRLTDGGIRKSASMGNLTHYTGSTTPNNNSSNNNNNNIGSSSPGGDGAADGYASEDFVQGSSGSSRERKKGVPWTEEEHKMFLLGLQKLGKGDWRGIARNYVVSRTPTQVASHAQKYFIRQTNATRRKRRSSLFDIVPDELMDTPQLSPNDCQHKEEAQQDNVPMPAPPPLEEECESMDSTNSNDGEVIMPPKPDNHPCNLPIVVPTYYSPFFPFSFPYWPGYRAETSEGEANAVLRPTAVHSKSPINVNELVGMSKLSLGDTTLSLKLGGGSERQSAFHANPAPSKSSSSSDVNSSANPIQAV